MSENTEVFVWLVMDFFIPLWQQNKFLHVRAAHSSVFATDECRAKSDSCLPFEGKFEA